MKSYFIHLNYRLLLPVAIFSFVLFSCVYFNTFYNAETSFAKALKIIEESPIIENEKLPSQATKLLGEAIENSKLVLEKFPDSKYIDDAIFIIARASFLRGEIAIAEKNFKLILQHYPESKYYTLSEIWLAYTHFRIGMVDSAKTELRIIQAKKSMNKEQLFIIHNVLAEIAMEVDSLELVYHHYELAAGYASSDSQKTATYGRLVNIAENDGDKKLASNYLEELDIVAPDNIRIASKMQWIIYQRELGEFDKIIVEIENMLNLSEFQSEYIKLELELGKVYMDKGDFSISKDIFLHMVEIYSKKNETAEAYYHLGNITLREDFNLDLTKEYFEKSRTEKSQSKYGKKSKELLSKITRFENLQEVYKDMVKAPDEEIDIDKLETELENYDMNIEVERSDKIIHDENIIVKDDSNFQYDRFRNSREPMDFDVSNMLNDTDLSQIDDKEMESTFTRPDSVLFMIGEMLLYDFNHLERSLEKFKTLAEKYPQSGFASQALYVLSHFEPDGDWQIRLKKDSPNSSFFLTDSTARSSITTALIESQRDYAWSLAHQSYEDAYAEFNRLYTERQDTLSAYITGFISDIYLNDIERAVTHYMLFIEAYPHHSYYTTVKTRMEEINQSLKDLKDISQQGIDYQIAVNYLHREFNYDSVKVLLSKISLGISSSYNNAANSLKAAILDYEELSAEVYKHNTQSDEDSLGVDLVISTSPIKTKQDSILFQLATLFSHQLEFVDSAIFYHNVLIKSHPNSKYRPHSILFLSEMDPTGNWIDVLNSDYPDTSYISDSTVHRSIYSGDIYQDGFADQMESQISNCEIYLELFPESMDASLMIPDSTGIEIDFLNVPIDTLRDTLDSSRAQSDSIKINLDFLQQDLLENREELAP